MKKILFTILIFASLSAIAQNISKKDTDNELKPLQDKIKTLEEKNTKIDSDLRNLKIILSNLTKRIDSLNTQVTANKKAIDQTVEELKLKITTSEETTNQKISKVDNSLSKTTLWAIIGMLSAIIVFCIAYWVLSKKQKSDKTDMIEQLSKTKSAIEEGLVKEFDKQTELIEVQMGSLEPQKVSENTQHDHSLALKLASEINIIERNIALMETGTRGLKQLVRSVEKLRDNLAANGYEMPQLLRKPFNEGMKVIVANSIPDTNLEKGTEIITKILIPQVNYDGIMIQTAEIEVSVGI